MSVKVLQNVTDEKDLGVIFDKSFSFKSISKVVYINKANKIIGVTKRTFTFLDKEIFNDLYKPLVRPPLEYCNIIWSPYLKRQSVTIKRVQRRATRLISFFRDLSYTERLKELDLPTLKYRRFTVDLIQVLSLIHI